MKTYKFFRAVSFIGVGLAASLSMGIVKAKESSLSPSTPIVDRSKLLEKDLPSELDLHKARTQYELAVKYLNKGRLSSYKKIRAELDDYPLANYLDYYYLKKQIKKSKYHSQIEHYLYEHEDTLLATKLQREWLYALSKQNNWAKFIEQYDVSVNSAALRCEYFWAQYKSGNKELALAAVPALWLTASSQPKRCDKLFEVWISSGQLTQDIVWERFNLALANKKLSLAKYLAKKLKGERKQQSQTLISVYRKPRQISTMALADYSEDFQAQLISLAVTRLARKNPADAYALWQEMSDKHAFLSNYAKYDQTLAYVAKRLAIRFDDLAYKALSHSDPQYQSYDSTILKLRVSLRDMQWAQVLEGISHLPITKQRDDVWQYWRAKSLLILERDNKQAMHEVNHILRSLADRRSFYGFLAAEMLTQDYQVTNIPLVPDATVLAELQGRLATRRVVELRALGEVVQARREWHYQTQRMDEQELIAAANLAKKWEWHNKAIRTTITAKQWDDLDLRFPIVYEDWISQHASKNKIDTSWVFAVARQESAFLEDARSHVGATGLLQLMPRTAKQTARKAGIRYRNKHELVNPKKNIVLGTAYLKEMLQKFDGNKAYATAAYNAGPHRVKSWLKGEQADLPMDIWIETIPFSETRRYVKNVLTFDIIYDTRLDVAAQSLAFIFKDDSSLQALR